MSDQSGARVQNLLNNYANELNQKKQEYTNNLNQISLLDEAKQQQADMQGNEILTGGLPASSEILKTAINSEAWQNLISKHQLVHLEDNF